MSKDVQHTTTKNCGLTRDVTWNPNTGSSTRQSVSAGTHVNNGTHKSIDSARREGARDIARGTRSPGDTHYRGK